MCTLKPSNPLVFLSILPVNPLSKVTPMIYSPWSWRQSPRSSSAVSPMRMSQGRTRTSCSKRTTSYRTWRGERQFPISARWSSLCWWGWSIVIQITQTILPSHPQDTVTMHRPQVKGCGNKLSNYFHLILLTLTILYWNKKYKYTGRLIFIDMQTHLFSCKHSYAHI